NLVRKLLELEIPEVKSGLVEIKAIAREPGVRCKVAVSSSDEKIDPIGSCVGQKGVRVQNIMEELNGERIDIIQWSEKMEDFIKTSLAPAKTAVIRLFEKERRAKVYVESDQRPLAIGKQGQNVRLASILTNWEIDVLDVSDMDEAKKEEKEAKEEAKAKEVKDLDLNKKLIEKLEAANLSSVEQIKGLSAKDFAEVEGIDEKGAKAIYEALKKA
ncbi:transcription termination/antitermination protein NusA, partial [Patescibacteria group bacterium]|nr:transcription termination/antitermination protein NusA [Patescibacteria group bacterium]